MIGSTISHYRILEKLGEGGMGVVYKAHDTKLDRDVALKFLPDRLSGSPDELARFEIEARSVSALNHPGIATIHDVDATAEHRFLVLEYLPGGTLKAHLNALRAGQKDLPVGDLLEYGIQIAEGLDHAHRHGIVHRDVKTDNVMLAGEGRVKLTDFGLAKLRGAAQLTRSGSTLGTAAYMSPEQIRGEEVDGRSDIFSLGVILYEMATMRMPFRGEHEAALTYSIVNEEPVKARTIRPDVPQGLEGIITRCLEKERNARFHSAADVASALKEVRSDLSGSVKTVVKHSKLPYLIAAGMAVLAVIMFLILKPGGGGGSGKAHTIAVLPFSNLGGGQEDEYFSDGMTEDIITHLAKIRDLKVISRTSVMKFKNTTKPIREIAAELNAGVVLEGSVRRAGNQVRITAQLIDAATDEHIWAETYDKDYDKIFQIQSDVAQKIASALEASLSPAEKARLETVPTSSTEAYTLYLKGRYFWNRRSAAAMPSALKYFTDAVAVDSNYALAWTGIADCYLAGQGLYLHLSAQEAMDRAGTAVRKALSIDPTLAEAHSSLGALLTGRFDWEGAEHAFRRSLELNPGYATGRQWYGELLFITGRFDSAIVELQKSVELDPISPVINSTLGFCYVAAGDGARALAQEQKILDADPTFIDALDCKTQAMLLLKKPDAEHFPVQLLRDSIIIPLDEQECRLLRNAFSSGGMKGYWRERLGILHEKADRGLLWWEGFLAESHAQVGDRDRAFDILDKMMANKDPWLMYVGVWVYFDPLHADPRFLKLLKALHLPQTE